jgi:hypothetical protein
MNVQVVNNSWVKIEFQGQIDLINSHHIRCVIKIDKIVRLILIGKKNYRDFEFDNQEYALKIYEAFEDALLLHKHFHDPNFGKISFMVSRFLCSKNEEE